MCNRGNSTIVDVTIPADLSHTGEARKAPKGVDTCIAPIVKALEEAGIVMRSSCCGHGEQLGVIMLQDKRLLLVVDPAVANALRQARALELKY